MGKLEKHVLVVDDYNTMRRILRNLWARSAFAMSRRPRTAPPACKMRERPFGLVISDWNMAPMSGLEFLKEVRSDGALKDTPFIMITAESKTENVVAAKAPASATTSSSRSTPTRSRRRSRRF